MTPIPADLDRLRRERDEIVRQDGPWTMHNIRLGEGLYTMDTPDGGSSAAQLTQAVQLVSDLVGPDLSKVRILDLACLEGAYAIEFALHGAEVVGIDIRETHLVKANFVKDALGLERLSFVQGDVRHLNPETHGRFDVVYCCGIFYHLDAHDQFEFAAAMHSVCDRALLLDTHVSIAPKESRDWRGNQYWGCVYREHPDDAEEADRERRLWQSIDNTFSFWPTEDSLMNLLTDVGFTSVSRCLAPFVERQFDRRAYVALAGESKQAKSRVPVTTRAPKRKGKSELWVSPFQLPMYGVWETCRSFIPDGVKTRLKSALGIYTPPVLEDDLSA